MEGDVRKPEDAKRVVESTYQHFGRIDILINAAAGNFLSAAEDLSTNGFRTGGSTFSHSSFSYKISFEKKRLVELRKIRK